MSALKTIVKNQFYLDSVALMRMSKSLTLGEGVEDAAMMMATPANIAIMQNAGLLDAAVSATPADLLISVRAVDQTAAEAVLENALQILAQPQGAAVASGWRPRSIRSAVSAHSDANLALISVPGDFAASEARKAIRNGLHAMIFSDNVSLQDEAELKQEAFELGRLVMGPDCGTAIINGVPLAFANVLPRGSMGIIGASGTGIQEISCLLGNAGIGISHAIGVGGRDLKDEVGGISTLMAIDALENDDETQHIILISKPPAADVAAAVLQRVGMSRKSFTICFIGGEPPALPENARWAATLFDAADLAVDNALLKVHSELAARFEAIESMATTAAATGESASRTPSDRFIRGLYCGGTLCAEAQVLMRNAGLAVASNAAIAGVAPLANEAAVYDAQTVHTVIDLGADEYTQGRPHPMIEPAIRDQSLLQAFADEKTAVILIDCVIGLGSHTNPAQILADCMQSNSRAVPVVASITGSEKDPQVRSAQARILSQCGIQLASCNAEAAAIAIQLLRG